MKSDQKPSLSKKENQILFQKELLPKEQTGTLHVLKIQ